MQRWQEWHGKELESVTFPDFIQEKIQSWRHIAWAQHFPQTEQLGEYWLVVGVQEDQLVCLTYLDGNITERWIWLEAVTKMRRSDFERLKRLGEEV